MTLPADLQTVFEDKRDFQSLIASSNVVSLEILLDDTVQETANANEWDNTQTNYIYRCFYHMILNEKTAFQSGYHVFYRLVRSKYVLYQFNTLMLSTFCDAFSTTAPNSFLCVPCLEAEAYPTSMINFLHLYRTKWINIDTDTRAQKCLLSVNCSLTPSDRDPGFHGQHIFHYKEASPLQFTDGYDETHAWTLYLADFMVAFFDMDLPQAQLLIQDLLALYGNDSLGHCIQLLVPRDSPSYSVFPCLSYGTPIAVFRSTHARRTTYKSFPLFVETSGTEPRKPNPALQTFMIQHVGVDYEELDMDDILHAPCMAKIQARLIAHPLLFTGAHRIITRIFSGSVAFDPTEFLHRMRQLMAPYMQKALLAGKKLQYTT